MDEIPVRFDDASPYGEEAPSLIPAAMAGAVAAVASGVVWAVVVAVTGYEIGYAAVGLGALVGVAMSRSTPRRDTTAAVVAAVLALAGLVTARIVIAEFVMPRAEISGVLEDPELMVSAAVLDIEMYGSFPADLQAEYDAIPPGALIPDPVYEKMRVAATAHLAETSESGRTEMAQQFVEVAMGGEMDLRSRVRAQLTLFDALWVFLALSTAWKLMSAPGEDDVVETPAETA